MLEPIINVEALDYRGGHVYKVGAIKYPSVTGILNIIGGSKTNALMVWARREALKLAKSELFKIIDDGKEINVDAVEYIIAAADKQPDSLKNKAADRGTRVHNAIDAYIKGEPYEIDEDAKTGFDNFMKWLKESKLTLIMPDTSIVSPTHGFGGRMDALATDEKGDYVILDWKTSNALREEYPLQVAAYKQGFKETYGIDAKRAIVVRFGKDDAGDFETKEVNLEKAWDAFTYALGLKNSMKEVELWQ